MYTNMLEELRQEPSSMFDFETQVKTRNFLHHLSNIVYGEQRRMLSFGFIQAGQGNQAQAWHTDYRGKTENILIPMVRMNDLNGTEYVHFEEPGAAEFWFWYIYSTHDEAEELPPNLFPDDDPLHKIPNAPSKNYTIKRWHSEPYTINRMPYYLYHRGPTNESNELKVLFYIVCTDDPTYTLETHEKAPVITGNEDKGNDQIPGTEEYERKKQLFSQKVSGSLSWKLNPQ